ncbi:uncharacterized protein LOC125179497 [Hyalella azteca]|uniref:Uncharacterized protein LOC125179497 n=1 Tax=Hyalella azteca TaxID=294128 RepID=A0A979FXL2_HYAAZ|nr:uncharacterized protein LOC125179497 [Hyalella azteca]
MEVISIIILSCVSIAVFGVLVAFFGCCCTALENYKKSAKTIDETTLPLYVTNTVEPKADKESFQTNLLPIHVVLSNNELLSDKSAHGTIGQQNALKNEANRPKTRQKSGKKLIPGSALASKTSSNGAAELN